MLPLGPDGGGFDVMGLVVPWFQVLNAAVSVGIAGAAIERPAAPATQTRYEHLGQTLADQPVSRAHIARMRIQADEAPALLDDTLAAVESGRDDVMLPGARGQDSGQRSGRYRDGPRDAGLRRSRLL